MKQCFKCLKEKRLSEFHKHSQMADGHLNKCKECARADAIATRQKRIAYYRQFDRDRGMTPKRVAARKRYQKENPEVVQRIKDAWNKRNTVKRKAIQMLNNAQRYGKIVKQPCERCGTTKWVHGHHDDYSKPLEVKWLCAKHHKERHAELKRGI